MVKGETLFFVINILLLSLRTASFDFDQRVCPSIPRLHIDADIPHVSTEGLLANAGTARRLGIVHPGAKTWRGICTCLIACPAKNSHQHNI